MLALCWVMARVPRSLQVLAGFSVHKVWRGHNKEWNLRADEHKESYLGFLNADLESKKYQPGGKLQALTVMSNHTHEVFEVQAPKLFSHHMRRHHARYGAYFNRLMQRCGKVAQDRPRTCLLADSYHEMNTVLYVHANPIRAAMQDARNYRWSTHKLYAFGKRESWMRNIVFPQWYLKLGRNMRQRQRNYRKLFEEYLKRYGRFKQSFLKPLFYGPYEWKQKLERKVHHWYRAHAPP